MGVLVVFTKVLGHAKSQSPRALRVLGLSDFTRPWIFANTTTPIYILRQCPIKRDTEWDTLNGPNCMSILNFSISAAILRCRPNFLNKIGLIGALCNLGARPSTQRCRHSFAAKRKLAKLCLYHTTTTTHTAGSEKCNIRSTVADFDELCPKIMRHFYLLHL